MKAEVWLAVSGEEATDSQFAELVPGRGVTLDYLLRADGEPQHLQQLLWADRHPSAKLQVVIEPKPASALGGDYLDLVTAEQLKAAFNKWATADAGADLPAVRRLAWTVWRAAYYWAAIVRREGLASAMTALDRPPLGPEAGL